MKQFRAAARIPRVDRLSPAAWRRIVPFLAFMGLLGLRGAAPDDGSWGFDARWLYGLTLPVVGGLLALWWRDYGELARRELPPALEAMLAAAVGIVVCALWVMLDARWMRLGEPTARFVPVDAHGALLWPLIAVRWVGAALLVPVMEELFWRSFLMRWVESVAFDTVDPRRVGARAVAVSTFCFMLAHPQWLAAVVAGLAYAWLYRRSGNLWTAVLAHATTNGALGVWVVATRQWQFW